MLQLQLTSRKNRDATSGLHLKRSLRWPKHKAQRNATSIVILTLPDPPHQNGYRLDTNLNPGAIRMNVGAVRRIIKELATLVEPEIPR